MFKKSAWHKQEVKNRSSENTEKKELLPEGLSHIIAHKLWHLIYCVIQYIVFLYSYVYVWCHTYIVLYMLHMFHMIYMLYMYIMFDTIYIQQNNLSQLLGYYLRKTLWKMLFFHNIPLWTCSLLCIYTPTHAALPTHTQHCHVTLWSCY